MRTCLQTMDSLKVILPRELVSDGVLEYKIPSSTIWNRCSWVGTHFGNDVTEPYSSLGWQKVYCIVCVINLDVAPDFLYISPCNIPILMLSKSEKNTSLIPVLWPLDPPLPLLPRLTVFLWCSEFPSCLAPFEIGYNVEGLSTKILLQLQMEFY